MITIAVAAGSQKEILSLVKKAKEKYANVLHFVVFDKEENIADDSIWTYFPCQDDEDTARQAVAYVANGQAQILLKGIISTHTLLKELLKSEHKLKEKPLLSFAAKVEIPAANRSFLLTDCAMNIQPTKEEMVLIIENVKEVAHKIGITQPKIALLCAAENINPKMPSSVMADELTQHFKDSQDAIVYGPLSFDLALSKEAVEHKRFTGPIMGDADILVAPTIDVGNSLYKALTLFGGAQIGGSIVGVKVPVVLTSRSDSTQTKLHSLEFAMKQL